MDKMDKERAKFILESFRPDGADVDDADFAEALRFATSDRELGNWLMRERAFDAEFAEALARVDLPEGLRERVMLAMVQDDGDAPKVDLKQEAEMMDAVASIEVPVGLRDRVLEAMEQSAKVEPIERGWSWARFGIPLAAVAGIALAFVAMRKDSPVETQVAQTNRITIDTVKAGFVDTYDSPTFSLDTYGQDTGALLTKLGERGLPVADEKLPPGLESLRGMGCRELEVNGKRGSLLCFNTGDGLVHLVTFERDDISGEFKGMEAPDYQKGKDWVAATWADQNHVYTLIEKDAQGDLNRFF